MSDTAPSPRLAGWFPRVVAHLIDVAPIIALFVILASLDGGIRSSTENGFSFSINLDGLPALLFFAVNLAYFGWNWLYLEGSTGQTWAKKALGISLVSADTGRPLGAGLVLGRQCVHILDTIACFIGWLWPIWDREKRTFADIILDTRVVVR